MRIERMLAAVVLSLALISRCVAADPLRVGLAEVDITPPVGFPMAGYYHERLAEGAIDPLKARAIVFWPMGGGMVFPSETIRHPFPTKLTRHWFPSRARSRYSRWQPSS